MNIDAVRPNPGSPKERTASGQSGRGTPAKCRLGKRKPAFFKINYNDDFFH